jgi:hypothetical protein
MPIPALTPRWPRSRIGKRLWHLVVQVLCFYKKPPTLRLTDAARQKLLVSLTNITEFEPIATVLWSSTVISGVASAPRWGVAYYEKGTRPYGMVTSIQGVPFVFTQKRAYTHLNGATLDYRDGRFVVDEPSSTA